MTHLIVSDNLILNVTVFILDVKLMYEFGIYYTLLEFLLAIDYLFVELLLHYLNTNHDGEGVV